MDPTQEAPGPRTPGGAHLPGSRIRQLRVHRGMSLRGFAAAVGVSPASVSQLERGINDPSLAVLRRIAETLEVPLFDLFQDPATGDVAVQRADEAPEVATPHHELVVLRLTPPNPVIELLDAALQPGAASSEGPHGHPSSEAILVRDGTLDLEVAGSSHRLGPGDSAAFDSRLPHRYRNPGAEAVRFLICVTPPSY